MLTEHEIQQRREAADNALASQRLEGLEPDPQTVEEVERYVAGKAELQDVIANFLGRVKRDEIRGQ